MDNRENQKFLQDCIKKIGNVSEQEIQRYRKAYEKNYIQKNHKFEPILPSNSNRPFADFLKKIKRKRDYKCKAKMS